MLVYLRFRKLEDFAEYRKEVSAHNTSFKKLEKAKGRGRWWFSMFLWFLSVCFAMFVGGAMEAGKSN